MNYANFPPAGAIIGLQHWLKRQDEGWPAPAILLDVISSCSWPQDVQRAEKAGRTFRDGVELVVHKPNARLPGEFESFTRAQLDPEMLFVLMTYGLAGGRIVKTARGDGRYHYLELRFPGEIATGVHRLVVHAPEDRDCLLPNHHDYRRRSLGSLSSLDDQRKKHGIEKVRLEPRGTRQSTTAIAIRRLHATGLVQLLPEETFRKMLDGGYDHLDKLPLGLPAENV